MIRKRVRADKSLSYQVIEQGVRTLTFDNPEDAEDYRADARRRRRLGSLYVAPPESFGAMLDGYVKRRATLKNHRQKTKEGYREIAAKLDGLRDVPVPALRTAHIEDLIAEIAVSAPRQATRSLQLCKSVLRSSEVRGQQVDRGIFQIEAPSYDTREGVLLGREQVYELASWMSGHISRSAPFAALTGLRLGEFLSLTDEDVDLDSGTLRVRESKTKAGRRMVDLNAETARLLREQLLERPHSELVFPTLAGTRWSPSNYRSREFGPACRRAGLSGIVPHDLRHTAISWMRMAGEDPEYIARQVGHSDGGALIFKKYRHLAPNERRVQLARFDAWWAAVEA
jgi:integrase